MSRKPHLVVTGNGSSEGAADRCLLFAGINVMRPTVPEAISEVSALVKQVLDALAEQGITGSKVRTTNLAVSDFFDQRQQIVTARVGSYELAVTIDDLDTIGAVLTAMTNAAGDSLQVRSLQLTVRDPSDLRRRARTAAVADAQAKAEQIAGDAGVTLGGILSIEESQTLGGQVFRAAAMPAHVVPAGGTIIPPMPVEAGSLSVTESVRVTYRLAEHPIG